MQVSECMTQDVKVASPSETLQQAARAMAEADTGFLPVGDNDRLVGIITDRDIAIRAVGCGCAPDTRVRDVMSEEVRYCFEDDDVDDVLDNMAEEQIRRLPVVNRDKRLVGVVSIGDLAASSQQAAHAGKALGDIARPSSQHSQTI